MATLKIEAQSAKTGQKLHDMTESIISSMNEHYGNNISDKIRAMQELNRLPYFKWADIRLTWHLYY